MIAGDGEKGKRKIIKIDYMNFDFWSKSAQPDQLRVWSRNTLSVQDLGGDPCLE